MKKAETEHVQSEAQGYTKAQLLQSQRFAADRDVLTALLVDDQVYTLIDVQQQLDKFYQREVQA
ncbi:hypothetical protein M3223_08815 [Paenibacillus pasadenensis]|uniref:hypothetical protein n=1 Tax=Paenibacillus pasadenensis TaxID=217090 RepID=UPI00203AFA1B|nr:hypothetical protein [Paenibacillus pasadenensis]MCM3747455.1 hypothetical protein [Paenibacillus pasadenensis]